MFKDTVLAIVAAIPKGEMMTYVAVAAKAGRPKAARAVGTIMKNNYNPDVPCHRVIRSDGTLGDYNRGGAAKKRVLLLAEGVRIP
jgi:O-6-methylguanine DNA methyltransferase